MQRREFEEDGICVSIGYLGRLIIVLMFCTVYKIELFLRKSTHIIGIPKRKRPRWMCAHSFGDNIKWILKK